jgi:hypothetical protein
MAALRHGTTVTNGQLWPRSILAGKKMIERIERGFWRHEVPGYAKAG